MTDFETHDIGTGKQLNLVEALQAEVERLNGEIERLKMVYEAAQDVRYSSCSLLAMSRLTDALEAVESWAEKN